MINPAEDGKTHINIYSKGATWLGRFLSNFADCHVDTDDGPFRTIEGYWYWLSTKNEDLRKTDGFASKKLGRELGGQDWSHDPNFEFKISKAILQKMNKSEECKKALIQSGIIPFYHYYVYKSKVVMPKDGLWMITLIDQYREYLLRGELFEVN